MNDAPISVSSEAPRYRFSRHDRLNIDGRDYRWAKTTDLGHLLRRTDDLALAEHFSHDEIAQFLRESKLSVHRDWYLASKVENQIVAQASILSELPEKELDKILWRQEYCNRFLAMERDKLATRSDRSMSAAIAKIKVALEERPRPDAGRCGKQVTERIRPKPSCLRSWLSRYQASAYNPLSLRDGYGRSGNRSPRVDAESHALAVQIANTYASKSRPTKIMLYKQYEDALQDKNAAILAQGEHAPTDESCRPLQLMGRRSFERLIDRLDPVFVYAGREGVDAARRKFGMNVGGLEVTRPLERVEIDEWLISLQVLLVLIGAWEHMTEEQKAAVKRDRVWLSAAEDCATRCILALRVLAAAPSADSALSLIEMAVMDKTHISSALRLGTAWDQHGTMETVAMDSGAAFVAIATQAGIRDLGAEPFYPPAGVPKLRGRIERLFRTFQTTWASHFPGQTFENVVAKGDYNSEAHAGLLVAELNQSLVAYVVDAYHNSPHAGLGGETPRNAWLRLTAKFGTLPPPDPTMRRHIFGVALKRRINNSGIRVLGIHYQSRALQQLRRTVNRQPVLVRVDRYNLREISVQTANGWLAVNPAIDSLNLNGVTYWEWVAACADLRRKHADVAKLSAGVVQEALARVREAAEVAIQRAEMGSPILGAEDFNKIERLIYPTFGSETADATADAPDILDGGQPAPTPTPTPVDREVAQLSVEDSFGSPDDWLTDN